MKEEFGLCDKCVERYLSIQRTRKFTSEITCNNIYFNPAPKPQCNSRTNIDICNDFVDWEDIDSRYIQKAWRRRGDEKHI